MNNSLLGCADWNLWPLSRDYSEIFHLLKSLGINNVELGIYVPDEEMSHEHFSKVMQSAQEDGINISAVLFALTNEYWPYGAMANLNSDFLEQFEGFLSALDRYGIENANVWTGVDMLSSNLNELSQTLKYMDQISANFRTIVSIEYKDKTIFDSAAKTLQLLEGTNNLKILVDTGHAYAINEDPVMLIKQLDEAGRLGAIHLGDAKLGDSDSDLPCGRIHDFGPLLDLLEDRKIEIPLNFDLYGAVTDPSGPGPLAIIEECLDHVDGRKI